jgi:hypothetical protein
MSRAVGFANGSLITPDFLTESRLLAATGWDVDNKPGPGNSPSFAPEQRKAHNPIAEKSITIPSFADLLNDGIVVRFRFEEHATAATTLPVAIIRSTASIHFA